MSAVRIEEAYAHCVALTKRRARNFYYAFITLPRPAHRAICALYAYCRLLDDVADGDAPLERKKAELGRIRGAVEKCVDSPGADPVFCALGDAVRRFDIPLERLDEVAEGVTWDLQVNRYETIESLEAYCRLVASSVGLACLEVFGYRNAAAREPAAALGLAMQITNVLRDVAEDAARGRIYLPLADMERFGVSERQILAGESSPEFLALMSFEATRAHRYYQEAQALFRHLPRRSRPCPMVLFGTYRNLLQEIEASGFDVFRRRISLSRGRRVRSALLLWAKGLLWKPVV